MNPPQQALPVPDGSSAFSAMPYQPPQNIIPPQTQTKKCPTFQEIKEFLAKAPLVTYFIVITYSIYFILHVLGALYRVVFFLSLWRVIEHGFGFMLHALFLYFFWFPIANKIESSSGTTRYATMFLFNIILLKIGYGIFYSSQCYDSRFYYSPYTWFVEFETALVTLINRDKKLKVYTVSISNKFTPFIIVVYYCFISYYNVFPIVTGIYAVIYSKCFMNCLAMSNERVESIEKNCIVAFIIRKCKRYVTIPKDQQQPQPAMDVTNSNINNYPQVPQVQPQITPSINSSMNTVININQIQDRAETNNSWSDLKNDFNNNHL